VLRMVGEQQPGMARNLLVSPKYLAASDGARSRWFSDTDVGSDFVASAAEQGFTAISPVHGSPFSAGVGDADYRPFATPELVSHAHDEGLRVIPYVVDDEPTMARLIEIGTDGLITNRPDVLRALLARQGDVLPNAYPG